MNGRVGETLIQNNRQDLDKIIFHSHSQSDQILNNNSNVYQALDTIFPEQKKQDKNIKEARKILGNLAQNLTNHEIRNILADIDFLVTAWLDEFEKDLFEGKTLKKLLHEKGGL